MGQETPEEPGTVRELTEVRLALVIEGGLSLAVWMSGIVREINELLRATRVGAPDADLGDAHRLWAQLCRDLGVRPVVDLVSGTSAGGLNGALLAASLASGNDLPDLRQLWRDQADLRRDALLHPVKPGEPLGPLPSLLDGRYFEGRLKDAFRQTLDGPTGGQGRPVTLLTTATALGDQKVRWADSSGHDFDVADHRRVFVFRNDPTGLRYHPNRDLAVDPTTVGQLFTPAPRHDFRGAVDCLARATRATAGFPGAFAPVAERDSQADLTRFPPATMVTGWWDLRSTA